MTRARESLAVWHIVRCPYRGCPYFAEASTHAEAERQVEEHVDYCCGIDDPAHAAGNRRR